MIAGPEVLAALLEIYHADRSDSDQDMWCHYYFGTVAECEDVPKGAVSDRLRLLDDIVANAGTEPRPC